MEDGTRIYDGEGRPVRLVSGEVAMEPFTGVITVDDFETTRGRAILRFAPDADPASCSVLVDWGGWRRDVTTSLDCALRDRRERDARVMSS